MIPERIARPAPVAPDADFDALRAAALGVIQTSQSAAARPWTDHNLHDPGITLLEAALFAIADLHHRIATRDTVAWEVEARDWRSDAAPHQRVRREALAAVLADPDAAAAARAIVAAAPSRAAAAAGIATTVPAPGGGSLHPAVARAVAAALRERDLLRAALERSGPVDAAVAEATSPAAARNAVAAAVADLGLWPEEIDALVARAGRRRLARLLRDRGDELRRIVESADDAATAIADLQGPFQEPEGALLALDAADAHVALAEHPCPPVAPERWEDAAGESDLWPPHALQARTCEPVTPADYRRLALAAPGVKRAFVVAGRAAGLDWKGDPANQPRPYRRGAFTLVLERAGLEPPRWDATLTPAQRTWLRGALTAALAGESGATDPDDPFPDYRAAVAEQALYDHAPRRLLGDEVGAGYVRSFGVVVKAMIEVEPNANPEAVHDDAWALLIGFLSSDRRSPLEPAPAPPAPLRPPDGIDGPWPPAAAVRPMLADPAGEVAARGWPPGVPVRASEVAQLLHSIDGVAGVTGLGLRRPDQPDTEWHGELTAPAGHEPYSVPAFHDEIDCLVARVRSEEACLGG